MCILAVHVLENMFWGPWSNFQDWRADLLEILYIRIVLADLTQQVPDGQADVGHEEPKNYEYLSRQKHKHIILYIVTEAREKTEKMGINKKCEKVSILQLVPEI